MIYHPNTVLKATRCFRKLSAQIIQSNMRSFYFFCVIKYFSKGVFGCPSLCAHEAARKRVSSILYHLRLYSLETGWLTESEVSLAVSKLQQYSCPITIPTHNARVICLAFFFFSSHNMVFIFLQENAGQTFKNLCLADKNQTKMNTLANNNT